MSWQQDWDFNADIDRDHCGGAYGFRQMSAAFIPRRLARVQASFVLTVLAIAGVAGAAFAALQCSHTVSHVISSGSHPAPIHHSNRKDLSR